MVLIQFDVIQNVICRIADGRPFCQLFFRIYHLIRTVAQQKLFLHIRGGSGHHQPAAHFLQQRGGLQRALKAIADGDDAYVKIPNAQRFQKGRIGAVADLRVGHIGQHRLDTLLLSVYRHDLMAQTVQVYGNVPAKAAQAN